MDLATIIGKFGAFGIILSAIFLGGKVHLFVNIPAFLIVFGGTFTVVMIKFSLKQFFNAIKVAINAFTCKHQKIEDLINTSIKLSIAARKNGMLSLENFETDNKTLKKGIQLLVDGHDSEVVNDMMKKDLALTIERHFMGRKIFKAIADVAPAMGMIGTLIGLIQMLSSMDDPQNIGPAMAIALLTTLYGAMIAHMVANPIADKLELRSHEEKKEKLLIIDTLNAIQSGHNPRVVEDLLQNYLPSKKRKTDAEPYLFESEEEEAG